MGFLLDLFGFNQPENYSLFDGIRGRGTQPPGPTITVGSHGWGDRILKAIGFYGASTMPGEKQEIYAGFDGEEGAGRQPQIELSFIGPGPPEREEPGPQEPEQPEGGGEAEEAHGYPRRIDAYRARRRFCPYDTGIINPGHRSMGYGRGMRSYQNDLRRAG